MFLVLWEFEVKSGCMERFQSVYGPMGSGSRLFRTDRAFIETRLLRDFSAQNKFVTLDFWQIARCVRIFKD